MGETGEGRRRGRESGVEGREERGGEGEEEDEGDEDGERKGRELEIEGMIVYVLSKINAGIIICVFLITIHTQL